MTGRACHLTERWLCDDRRGAWAHARNDDTSKAQWATSNEQRGNVPAALRAEGSMVPDGSTMPFPMPPFDMIGTGWTCTEYIPGGARAAELAGRCCARRGRGQHAGPMGGGARLGKERLATGYWRGGGCIRRRRAVGGGGVGGGCGGRWSVVAKGRPGMSGMLHGRGRRSRALQVPEVAAGGAKRGSSSSSSKHSPRRLAQRSDCTWGEQRDGREDGLRWGRARRRAARLGTMQRRSSGCTKSQDGGIWLGAQRRIAGGYDRRERGRRYRATKVSDGAEQREGSGHRTGRPWQ
jgi:hypothetical protein